MLTPAAATVKISKSSFTLTKGYCTTLSVTGTTSTPTWSTGNKSVATVSSKGKVVGRGVGSTYIYAKVNGKTLKSKVTVVAGKISVGMNSSYLSEHVFSNNWRIGGNSYSRISLYKSCQRNQIPMCRIAGKNYYSKRHIDEFFGTAVDIH